MTHPYKFPLIPVITTLVITAAVGVWLGIKLAPFISTHLETTASQQFSLPQAINEDTENRIVSLQQRIDLLQNENQRLSSQLQDQSLGTVSQQMEAVAINTDVKPMTLMIG